MGESVNLNPMERATEGTDRRFARSALLDHLKTSIEDGFEQCHLCQRRQAANVRLVNGRIAALCGTCFDAAELDAQIARQRACVDRMRQR